MSAIAKSTGNNGELFDAPVQDKKLLKELLEREGRIERAQRNAYYEVGLELREIKDRDLYRVERPEPVAGRYSFVTFEEYVIEFHDRTYSSAAKCIEAAETTEKLENFPGFQGILPARESHVRQLLKLELDEDRAAVWQGVVESGETITAKRIEESVKRFIAQKEKNWLTLDEWENLDDDEWENILNLPSEAKFNKQDNASIEWAQWSWNPVTGCKHDCPYCYARDIASRFYPQKFEPSIYANRLSAPSNTKVPGNAAEDIAYQNVFTCSMADLFGRWVPDQWIELVMEVVSENQQWNFLFLTKFPQRFAELGEFPENAWMGTTVDCQDRVANAEKAFAKLKGGTKWLSVEPMLTPLRFKKLDMFEWVVFGGASSSSKTPAWVPPFDWVHELHAQARKAGCAVYHKDNLGLGDGIRLKEFPWYESEENELPESFKYLNIK